jgi:hypothetical protein
MLDPDIAQARSATSGDAPPAGPAQSPPWVGVYVGEYGNSSPDYPALWQARRSSMGPIRVWRCFDPTIKKPEQARFRRLPGPLPAYSLKPPNGDHSGFARGRYSAAYRAVVSALPQGAFLAVWHEPEDDLTGDAFLALTDRAYADAKAVRPDVLFIYAAMAYQWRIRGPHTGSPAGWLEAAKLVDLATIDVYASRRNFTPMAADTGFRRWCDEIVVPSGTPWGVTERGISDHAGQQARADMLLRDWQHARGAGARVFLYFDADWDNGNWRLRGAVELAAMRRIAEEGRRP